MKADTEDKKTALYQAARELFASKGFKDTSVADITGKAGYSVGTFYNYYASKDRLFTEIMERETGEMMRGVLKTLDLNDDPVRLIKRLLALNMEGMLANPILRQWYDPEVSGKIERLFREDDGLSAMNFLYRDFHKLVQQWQREGKIRADIDSEMIMALFGAIIRIGYHKEEIGLNYFPALQDYLTDFVLSGLTDRAAEKGANI
ncbi:MAG: TetR/AcrR family transcriptional regulator [Bacillota bacterium]